MKGEYKAIELSKQLTATFQGMDIGERPHNNDKPVVVGILLGHYTIVGQCPFCGKAHFHGRMEEPLEYRGAHCDKRINRPGYWISGMELGALTKRPERPETDGKNDKKRKRNVRSKRDTGRA